MYFHNIIFCMTQMPMYFYPVLLPFLIVLQSFFSSANPKQECCHNKICIIDPVIKIISISHCYCDTFELNSKIIVYLVLSYTFKKKSSFRFHFSSNIVEYHYPIFFNNPIKFWYFFSNVNASQVLAKLLKETNLKNNCLQIVQLRYLWNSTIVLVLRTYQGSLCVIISYMKYTLAKCLLGVL